MRVAYLVNRYPSVSHTFIRREIVALERRGLEIVRYSIRESDADLPDAQDRGEVGKTRFVLQQGAGRLLASFFIVVARHPVRFVRAVARAWRMTLRGPGRLIRMIAYVAEAAWLSRAMTAARVAHIHAHFGTNPAAVARLTSLFSGIPYSFTAHGPEEFDAVEELAIAAKVREAKFVAVISAFGRSQMLRLLRPEDWAKVAIVHCGLEFLVDSAIRQADSPKEAEEYDFCFVGRFAPQKGLPTLVDALREIARRGESVSLAMIGSGELFEWFDSFRRNEGFADSITLLGVQAGKVVDDTMLASKAVLVPSYAEGLPVVIMEALANRRPVVSTFVAGIPELVTPNCGMLVPAGDAVALAEAMLAMKSKSAQSRAAMGEEGFARVRHRHDVAISAALLHQRIIDAAEQNFS